MPGAVSATGHRRGRAGCGQSVSGGLRVRRLGCAVQSVVGIRPGGGICGSRRRSRGCVRRLHGGLRGDRWGRGVVVPTRCGSRRWFPVAGERGWCSRASHRRQSTGSSMPVQPRRGMTPRDSWKANIAQLFPGGGQGELSRPAAAGIGACQSSMIRRRHCAADGRPTCQWLITPVPVGGRSHPGAAARRTRRLDLDASVRVLASPPC